MAFKKLAVPEKVRTGAFKIGTMSIKGGPWKLFVSMPHAEFIQRFGQLVAGQEERFSVFMGMGEDEGKIAIGRDPEGPIKPTFFRSCVIFRIGGIEGTPQAKFETMDPERRKNAELLLEIVLPRWWTGWRTILAARAK